MIRGRLPWPLDFQVLGVVAIVWLLAHTWQIWLLGFTALILAAAMLPAARLGERHRVSRALQPADRRHRRGVRNRAVRGGHGGGGAGRPQRVAHAGRPHAGRDGRRLAGLIGALVAVPFLAGLWEVVRVLWVEPRRDA